MRILLSNDDGFHAEGIQVLAAELRKIADVIIVAPDRNRSAASSSLTLVEPLRPRLLDNGDYCLNGTPADCVHLALNGFLSGRVDLVVSGINAGCNMGDDTIYSGTVAAAMEGRHLGLPSIAVSLDGRQHYETAARVVVDLIPKLHSQLLMIGYAIGYFATDWVQGIVQQWGYGAHWETAVSWFERWGVPVVFVAGFSPIPYKVFTICAGVMQMAFFPFVITAFVSRFARFFLVAKLAAWGGEKFAAKLRKSIEIIGWSVVVLAAVAYLILR